MLADCEYGVGDRQSEKDVGEDVQPVNRLHKQEVGLHPLPASSFTAPERAASCMLSSGYATVAVVQTAEPLYEVRVWVPQSLLVWIQAEAERRALNKSAFIRMHFSAVKERAEKSAA